MLRTWLLLIIALLPVSVHAQEDRLEITASLAAKEVKPGDSFTIKVGLHVKEGFHTYPTKQKDKNAEQFVTMISVKGGETAPIERQGEIKEPEGKDKLEQAINATITIFEHPVELEVPFVVKKNAKPGDMKFTLSVRTQVCDEMGCVPVSKNFEFPITVKGNGGANSPPEKNAEAKQTEQKKQPAEEKQAGSSLTGEEKDKEETLISFILTGVGFGFITLLTPCVFPMIPITVSFFLKQKKTGSEAIMNALIYTFTIVVALTLFAYLAVSFFQQLTQLSITNFILAALFLYFALSLFGAYEITLPGFLTRWTSAGEERGGYIGTVFMAMTFTLISFSCVAPFMGFFAGATAQARPVTWNLLGALSFSLAFASPFFLLAIFPSWLKALPKSGSWMNTLKVVMGFLEVAAAIKFLRTAEILWKKGNPVYLTYDVALGLYVTICLLCGLYLIGVFKLPHDDHDEGQNKIGVGRLLWSMIFLGLGFYLLPALFRGPDGEKMRPAGVIYSWIDAFLLPSGDTKPLQLSYRGNGDGKAADKQNWVAFLPEALTDAKSKKQRIFIDFTGVS